MSKAQIIQSIQRTQKELSRQLEERDAIAVKIDKQAAKLEKQRLRLLDYGVRANAKREANENLYCGEN